MRAVLQRVARASVSVEYETVGDIGPGLLVLLGIGPTDDEHACRWMADKIASLRIFADEHGRFNLSVGDTGGSVLLVSQFTLYADTRRGRRPGFSQAAPPEIAEPLVARVGELLRAGGIPVATGRFGAAMQVALVNDGPVTIMLESDTAS